MGQLEICESLLDEGQALSGKTKFTVLSKGYEVDFFCIEDR